MLVSTRRTRYLVGLMQAAAELYPEIPIVMHQDHGNSPETCFSAIRNQFTSVMMDGSLKKTARPLLISTITLWSPAGLWMLPTRLVCQWKVSWVVWVPWKPAKAIRKMATVSKVL